MTMNQRMREMEKGYKSFWRLYGFVQASSDERAKEYARELADEIRRAGEMPEEQPEEARAA